MAGYCNRSCWFCNRSGDNKHRRLDENGKRIRRFMPMQQIKNITQQLVDMGWRGRMCFNHMSEPTLDVRLVDIITLCKERGFQTKLSTNGDVMKHNEDLCNALCKACDIIEMGIYDVDDKTQQDIDELKHWWQERLRGCVLTFSVATSRFHRRFSCDDGEHIAYPNHRCTVPSENLVIHYDGEVALCCEDINCDFGLGNAFETSIVDIWTSKHRLELVDKLLKQRSNHPVCAACPIKPK